MTTHSHGIPRITGRTINGKPVAKAAIVEENGFFQAIVTDIHDAEYVSGSNCRDLDQERGVLRDMLDQPPAPAK